MVHTEFIRVTIHFLFLWKIFITTYAIINERNVVKVDKDIDLMILGPLGCGGVGLSSIMASKAVGASVILSVDVHPNWL